jgi:formate hydrogenlyase subunit 4
VSLAAIALIAAGAVLALLAAVELIARAAHARFFSTVILGKDGRTSTSKAFILLWTLLVGWALIALLIAGEFVSETSVRSADGRRKSGRGV